LQRFPDVSGYLKKYGGMTVPMAPWLTHQLPFVTVKTTSPLGAPKLTAWLRSTRVTYGERSDLFAELVDETGAALYPTTLKAFVRPPGHPELALVQNLEPSSDGVPNRFSTSLLLDKGRYRSLQRSNSAGPVPIEYAVEATGTHHGRPYARRAVGSFFIHEPGAELVASSAHVARRVSGERADLLLSIDIRVTKPGTYWAGAELWAEEKPVAQAQLRLGRLEQGEYPVTLLFGGAVLRDSQLDGPYTVHNVRLHQVDSVPPQEASAIAELEPTVEFRAEDFR